ncbi:MAG TPA: OadG family protein [Bacteroidales bacterium]|nr:OadG family protein [Bacteroidales bacterium]
MSTETLEMKVAASTGEEVTDEIVAVIAAAVQHYLETECSGKRPFNIRRGMQPLSPWSMKSNMLRQVPNNNYKR